MPWSVVWSVAMSSPFPGMDPHLEAHWGNVHHRLITYASHCVNPMMTPR